MFSFTLEALQMSRLTTLKDKILYRIRKSKENTFLIRDFIDLSDRDQILRALRTLIKNKELIRVGKGVYTKTRQSALTGDFIPKDNLRDIAVTTLNKLGVKIVPTPEETAYNNKLTEQVPNGLIIGVNKRVSRSISFNNTRIKYEIVSPSAPDDYLSDETKAVIDDADAGKKNVIHIKNKEELFKW